MAAECIDINPNGTRASEYNIYIGNTINECEEYIWRLMENFRKEFGNPQNEAVYFVERFLGEQQKVELAQNLTRNALNSMSWYQYD